MVNIAMPAPQITAAWLAANPWIMADPERHATRQQLDSAPVDTVVETDGGLRFRRATDGWGAHSGAPLDTDDLLDVGARIVGKPLPVCVEPSQPAQAAPRAAGETLQALIGAAVRAAAESFEEPSQASLASYAAACEDVETAARAHVAALGGPGALGGGR